MSRRARVFFRNQPAGTLTELPDGSYRFAYEPAYLQAGPAISVTLPLRAEPFESAELFPFFAGLVPEGWFLRIVAPTLKVDPRDTFGLVLHACGDCIGAVSIVAVDAARETPDAHRA